MFKNFLNKLAGSPYERELATYREVVAEVTHFENQHHAALGIMQGEPPEITDDIRAYLQGQVDELRAYVAEQVAGSEDKQLRYKTEQTALDEVLPQSFALTRVASWLSIGLRHYDVQLIGGLVMHRGKIAEMKTGEGKTLVASLPLVLNALAGRGVHLVTVNDYLARRDAGWMGPIYDLLGLTTAVVGKEQYSALFDMDFVDPGGDLEDERLVHWRPVPRRECYRADITYGTASEFGFDYLRDNTATTLDRTVQGVHAFAIVDEVDSVLIDTARTPLIISGPAGEAASTYVRFAEIVEKARLRRNTTDLSKDEEPDGDFALDDRTQTVSLTDDGIEKVERALPEINTEAGESIYDPQYYEMVHYLENALKAKYLFHRDKEYIVSNGSIVLIDQSTGRAMPSRRYSDGLHQAIEAKEGVAVQRENVTIATVTVQNYFRMYDKLSGMTGTAVTQAEEFDEVYNLDVVAIPTNVEYRADEAELDERKERHPEENVQIISYWDPGNPGDEPLFYKRTDYPDQVYMSVDAKFNAVANEIARLVENGRPILVGTGSVESSEVLSNKLKKMGLPHEVLNAKNNQREALIVAQAGRPGSVTISTNMAGRGTDILLGGSPEGLASKLITDRCFTINALQKVVTAVVEDDLEAAQKAARSERYMDEAIVEWVKNENNALVRKASVEDILGAVQAEIREMPEYADIPFDVIVEVLQQLELAAIDTTRAGRAQEIAEKHGLPASLIPDMEYRVNQYRSLSGLLGQSGHITTLTQMLMETHYNARAALVRAVLAGDIDEARAVTTKVPALSEHLISEVQDLKASCKAASREVWYSGGLHVIGTERHESRRIDDQLRGRAARQGDPGSSRFYLSLEDELMIRFGGERTKSMMERLNMPEEMPIAANILSGAIEQAQGRFETYYFEIRKNLIEYDEAVNRQRELVYDERRAVLEGDGADLDEIVRRFLGESIEAAIDRYRDSYEEWAMAEVESVITDFSSMETGEVNARGVLGRVKGLFPRVSEEDLNTLYGTLDSEDLTDHLHSMILNGMDEGYHLRMLAAEINRIVPLWPTLPSATDRGIPGWDVYVERLREVISGYLADMPAEQAGELETALYSELDAAYREYIAGAGRGGNLRETHSVFMSRVTMALTAVYQPVLEYLEPDELLDTLLIRIDSLLDVARSSDEADTPDHRIYGIGAEEIINYERALMLSVIDQEWRQYLQAIDDLRQGISLEAYGQRDPKVEFKRRAFDMFEALREGVRDGVSRRFFRELPRHRQIVEAQARRAAQLDQLAAQGYRIQRRTGTGGRQQAAASQTVEKDMWSSVGRNDPCPCGSGKKFKDCHYHQIRKQQATSAGPAPSGGRSSRRRRRR